MASPTAASWRSRVVDPIDDLLATDRDDDATPTEVAAHLFADLMAMRLQLGPDSRSFLLASPDLGIPDPDVLAVIERFVGEHPDVAFQTLSFVPGTTGRFLINGEQVRVTFPETAGVDLTQPRARDRSRAAAHGDTSPRCCRPTIRGRRSWRTELEALMSTGIDDAAVAGRLDRMERELRTIEQAIQPPEPFTFTLAGNASTITLRFGNTSTTALRIGVRVSGPSRLAFPQPDTAVTLEPGVTTDVTIPIEARSNGTSEVVIEVHTPSGSVIGEPIVLTARVNALSGLGQLLTGAALVGARDMVVQPLPAQAARAPRARQPAVTSWASEQPGVGCRGGTGRGCRLRHVRRSRVAVARFGRRFQR